MAADQVSKSKASTNSSMQHFTKATAAMQAVTSEMMAMSMESMRHASEAFSQMQGARSWIDIARIQQEFFRTSFDQLAQRSRRIAELAMSAPVDLPKPMVAKGGGPGAPVEAPNAGVTVLPVVSRPAAPTPAALPPSRPVAPAPAKPAMNAADAPISIASNKKPEPLAPAKIGKKHSRKNKRPKSGK